MGDVIHAAVDLQFVVGRVEAIEENNVEISWDSPLFIRSDKQPRVLVNQLDLKMRVLGYSDNLSLVE